MDYIDIHGHYAWQLDDGIESLSEAKKALEKASQDNIKTIVATPHVNDLTTQQDIANIKMRIQELQTLASEYSIDVKIGCELMINQNIEQRMKKNLFLPIELTKYILCEYDVRHIDDDYFENFDNYLLSLITRDYIPVIAHVERYYQRDNLDLEFVQYLIDMGCIIQINSSSLLHEGPFKNNAIQLLDHQLVHVIASDTHQAKGVRYPNLDECYHQLMKMGFDKQYLELLFHENPQRIIEDKYIIQPHFKKRSFIQKVLKNK